MASLLSVDQLRFRLHRFKERLWVRPLMVCMLSIAGVFAAKLVGNSTTANIVPAISKDSVETLLSLMAASMLVIATFSVASMVAAYSSASSSATPRSFSLVLADDVSQNALSTFVGAFIFSVVGLMAVKNAYYEKAGLFVLFTLTACVFAVVIITFVRWVDSIARLGRIGSTIDKVEHATAQAMLRRQQQPAYGGLPLTGTPTQGRCIFANHHIGYVQHIDMESLQKWAEETQSHVEIHAVPGSFVSMSKPLMVISKSEHIDKNSKLDNAQLAGFFHIDKDRTFEDDPRFGLIVLAEIAGRALSPAVNDPGTAIKVIGAMERLFCQSPAATALKDSPKIDYDRISVPEISVADMFNDAFTPIARDGASVIEVGIRLQKALYALELLDSQEMQNSARYHRELAIIRADKALNIEADLQALHSAVADNKNAEKL